MNGIHLMVSDKKGIYNTLKENHKRGGKCFFWFSTFFMWNRHMGTDPEELRIIVNAANKFQHLITLDNP